MFLLSFKLFLLWRGRYMKPGQLSFTNRQWRIDDVYVCVYVGCWGEKNSSHFYSSIFTDGHGKSRTSALARVILSVDTLAKYKGQWSYRHDECDRVHERYHALILTFCPIKQRGKRKKNERVLIAYDTNHTAIYSCRMAVWCIATPVLMDRWWNAIAHGYAYRDLNDTDNTYSK